MKTTGRQRLLGLALGAVSLIALATSCGMTDDDLSQDYDDFVTMQQPVKIKDISGFCKIKTDKGDIDIDEYLANVVSCEAAPTAGLETLKAQAIAARSFALGINFGQKRPLKSSQADQHYACGRPVKPLARQAVKETTGVVGQYNETLVSMYYKAGSERQTAQCRGIGPGATGTEHFITYNEGKTGSAVQGAYNQRATNDNRGDMSQWGAVCLENKGKKALDIIQFYYGLDFETIQLDGPCVGNTVDEDVLTEGAMCSSKAERPKIIERSGWGARPPRSLQPKHSPNRFSIHHAVSTNDASVPAAGQIRGFQDYHMDGHGWPDIGYHFLIDRKGNIYRGTAEDRIGTHVGNNNTGNIGISFLGQYQPPSALGIPAAEPTEAALKSAGRLIGYLSEKYNIDPTAPGKVIGHRDNPGQSTSCPGDLLRNKLSDIVKYADAGALCSRPERPYDEVRDVPKFDLESAAYKYVKIKAIKDEPKPNPANIGGFEVDSVMLQDDLGATAHYAASVHSKSDGVKNASGALGTPKNKSCSGRGSNAAIIPKGDNLVLKFDRTFSAGNVLSLVQGEFGGLQGCNAGYTAEIWISPDANKWVKLAREVASNVRGLPIPAPFVHFMSPREGGVYAGGSMSITVDTSPDVQEVEYFVGGKSIGTGTDWEDYFRMPHDFPADGKVKLTARAKGTKGQTLATETITVDVTDAFRFSSPRPGPGGFSAMAPPDATFKVVGGPDEVASVTYEADGYGIGSSNNAGSGFEISYKFNNLSGADGYRHIVAYGENADGEVIVTAELDVFVSDNIEDKIEWVTPGAGGWNTPQITLRTRRLDPQIISVDYSIKDKRAICRSDNFDTDFACTHKFEERGWVEVVATAYDTKEQLEDREERELHKIGEATIKIFIANKDGSVPGFDNKYGPPPAPDGAGGFGDGEADSAMAEKLATEGGKCSDIGNGGSSTRCSNGTGGFSTGSCWAFVKGAIVRSGLATRADIDRLAAKVGMSAYDVQVSASGFAHAADRASPEALAQTMGLKKLDVPPAQAPRGAIVGWFAGCSGYHATYGHIEISQGNGVACSDYCGRLTNATCGRVFVPIK